MKIQTKPEPTDCLNHKLKTVTTGKDYYGRSRIIVKCDNCDLVRFQ